MGASVVSQGLQPLGQTSPSAHRSESTYLHSNQEDRCIQHIS